MQNLSKAQKVYHALSHMSPSLMQHLPHLPSGHWSYAPRASTLMSPLLDALTPAPHRASLHHDFIHTSTQGHFLRQVLASCLKEQPHNPYALNLLLFFSKHVFTPKTSGIAIYISYLFFWSSVFPY